jgi:hypothetical protein
VRQPPRKARLVAETAVALLFGIRATPDSIGDGRACAPAFVNLQDLVPHGHDRGQAHDAAGLAAGDEGL